MTINYEKFRSLCQEVYLRLSRGQKNHFRIAYFKCFSEDLFFSEGDIVIGWHSGERLYRNHPWKIKRIFLGYGNVLYAEPNSRMNTGIDDIEFYTGNKEVLE